MSGFTGSAPHVHKEKGNAENVAFGNQNDHWSGSSFDFLRCRRLISPFAAVIKNPAVLSPSSLTFSISSRSSSGSLTDTCKDLLFFLPVAITESLVGRWCSVCTKKNLIQLLTWCSPVNILVVFTKLIKWCRYCEAQPDARPGWASNHNVSWSNIMACSHDTQTRPEFTYLFLGTPSDKPNVTPVVLRAEANTEQQARSHFLNWDLVFAAQIRTKAPCRLQLTDGDDHFSWIFEQRFEARTSGAQEVAHV